MPATRHYGMREIEVSLLLWVCRMCHNRNTFEQQFVTALASEFENFAFGHWQLLKIHSQLYRYDQVGF
jgi:hypothetical protein